MTTTPPLPKAGEILAFNINRHALPTDEARASIDGSKPVERSAKVRRLDVKDPKGSGFQPPYSEAFRDIELVSLEGVTHQVNSLVLASTCTLFSDAQVVSKTSAKPASATSAKGIVPRTTVSVPCSTSILDLALRGLHNESMNKIKLSDMTPLLEFAHYLQSQILIDRTSVRMTITMAADPWKMFVIFAKFQMIEQARLCLASVCKDGCSELDIPDIVGDIVDGLPQRYMNALVRALAENPQYTAKTARTPAAKAERWRQISEVFDPTL